MDGSLLIKISVACFLLALAAFIIPFFEDLLPQYRIWSTGARLIIAVSIVFIFWEPIKRFWKSIERPRRKLQETFRKLMPWLIPVNLILSLLILLLVQPLHKTLEIEIDKTRGAIFNSWANQPEQPKQIWAWGNHGDLMWVIDDQGAARFSYEIDSTVTNPDPNASSGGYVTFYNKPCDRLVYREVSFKCRATNFRGMPDIGIRLAVDDPKATQDRERVTYELPSLNTYLKGKKNIIDFWQTFTIDIGDFVMKRVEPPLPRGVDENTINKIVFFVNSEIVENCPEGTLWLRDIIFVD